MSDPVLNRHEDTADAIRYWFWSREEAPHQNEVVGAFDGDDEGEVLKRMINRGIIAVDLDWKYHYRPDKGWRYR